MALRNAARPNQIGVCSWSLQPDGPQSLVQRVERTGAQRVQLALDPLRSGAWDIDETVDRLRDAGIEVRSGMLEMAGEDYSTLDSIRETGGVRSDDRWPENLRAAEENCRLAQRLGLSLVTFHAGFLPHEAGDPLRRTMIDRLRTLARLFADAKIRVALETGQETADTLLDVLDEFDEPNVGVNFDPANMILYGMGDPIAALRALRGRVFQIHVKDAIATEQPGQWGTEVVAGSGEVDWDAFFAALGEGDFSPVDWIVEREAGDDRVGDVRRAVELVKPYLEGASR